MQFHQLAPPHDLRGYVRYFWTLETTGDAPAAPQTFTTLADGCPGLITQLTPGAPLQGASKPWPRSFLYGQTTSATEIVAHGPFQTLGVCFEPSALAAVFGLNAEELTNTCLDLTLLDAPRARGLAEELAARPTVAERLAQLADFLRGCFARHHAPVDARVRQSVAQLQASGGRVSLPALLHEVGLSERSLQRKFKHHVGISPQLFARICRFQASLTQLRASRFEKLSDLAFEQEYADQSHHIRAFQEFAGASPLRFRQQAQPGLPNFPELLR
ncbi:AraC family transcriptional regulator [Hymenobacter sp. BT523]|uniref:helix-turn-helix domain-containing protein n=1 Tax=Hymenobacter sp. BT523 TaxID=2795725 RepID=UPI0018ED6A90|nr:helix-turn-helix domain-containing protein [Hymenobacter sp. BT523]MBJ6109675.1 AraC family transcriptional regulator [Hymenobacter sp. BT523]